MHATGQCVVCVNFPSFDHVSLLPLTTEYQLSTEIVLPGTNTGTTAGDHPPPNKINAGQKILVIRTPKGVYIRTNDGKMFAVRSKSGLGLPGEAISPGSGVATSTTSTVSLATTSGNQGRQKICSFFLQDIFYFKKFVHCLIYEMNYQLNQTKIVFLILITGIQKNFK